MDGVSAGEVRGKRILYLPEIVIVCFFFVCFNLSYSIINI